MGATFPPDFLLDPAGAIPAEKLLANLPGDVYVDADAKFRPFDGVGQYADAHPRRVRRSVLGVREELEGVPPGPAPARDVVRALHLRPSDDAFVPHPNEISCVLLAFASSSAPTSASAAIPRRKQPDSSYLDPQVLYGTNAGNATTGGGGTPG